VTVYDDFLGRCGVGLVPDLENGQQAFVVRTDLYLTHQDKIIEGA
jgi:hypothetical protein